MPKKDAQSFFRVISPICTLTPNLLPTRNPYGFLNVADLVILKLKRFNCPH